MLIQLLRLRNFRVYEDPLELELPSGLVGIYGPNGAGKSTLLEAILWALWGRSRTPKDQIRSAGVAGDCVVEVVFEHEGHEYSVCRTLAGAASAARLEVECDGALVSSGVRDAGRFIESVLGMDDSAFTSSVFAEQKQIAAFSERPPEKRRSLVMQLLGITPLDSARDLARRDSHQKAAAYEEVRRALPDLEGLSLAADDARAAADAAESEARIAEASLVAAARRRTEAAEAFEAADRLRQEHEALVIEGRAAREVLDTANEAVKVQQAELQALERDAGDLDRLRSESAGVEDAERELEPLADAARTAAAAEAAAKDLPPEPPAPDEASVERARQEEERARDEWARVGAAAQAADAEVARASEVLERAADLSPEESCPLCGQDLGGAFQAVQAHRREEHQHAEQRARELRAKLGDAERAARAAKRSLDEALEHDEAARVVRQRWEQALERRAELRTAFDEAWSALVGVAPARSGPPPTAEVLSKELQALRETVVRQRKARDEARRLEGRLERERDLRSSLASWLDRAEAARQRVEDLRKRARAIGFDQARLDALGGKAKEAMAAEEGARRAREAAVAAAAAKRAEAEAAVRRLADGRAQHDSVGELAAAARHLDRTAALLGEFRNTVVAAVGPALAAEAEALFGELTDHEYEGLSVDPDSYQIQVCDGGVLYDLDRFSGSETDLANLALRVAISEHVRLLSGGAVGLLVLDEVFGPLDEERKARMLLALERLRARFRQVLVVTHDAAIKDQLPNAIEVVKLPGRRATARPVA